MDTINFNEEQSPIQPPNDSGSGTSANSMTSGNNTAPGGFSAESGFTPGPMDPPLRTPKTVREEIRKSRHKKEVPLYILLIILGFIAVGVILYRETQGEGILVELRTLIEEFLEEGVSGLEGTELSQVVGIVVLVLSLIFGIGSLTASHPIMPFRVRAILDFSKKSGRLL